MKFKLEDLLKEIKGGGINVVIEFRGSLEKENRPEDGYQPSGYSIIRMYVNNRFFAEDFDCLIENYADLNREIQNKYSKLKDVLEKRNFTCRSDGGKLLVW